MMVPLVPLSPLVSDGSRWFATVPNPMAGKSAKVWLRVVVLSNLSCSTTGWHRFLLPKLVTSKVYHFDWWSDEMTRWNDSMKWHEIDGTSQWWQALPSIWMGYPRTTVQHSKHCWNLPLEMSASGRFFRLTKYESTISNHPEGNPTSPFSAI